MLNGYPDVVRVRITASVEPRAETVPEVMKLDYREVETSACHLAAIIRWTGQTWRHITWRQTLTSPVSNSQRR